MLEFFRNSKISRFLMAALLAAMAAGAALSAWSANPESAPAPAEELKEYLVLDKPVAVMTGKKIEVTEVFWYRCPHCLALLPDLEAWKARIPGDAELTYEPAALMPNWAPGAKLFYTLQALGEEGRLHLAVFAAYHLDKLNLDDPAVAETWAKQYGIDSRKFQAAYRSQAVKDRMAASAKRVEQMGVNGVPALLIDGKYLTSVSMTGTPERLFDVVDQLIAKARADRQVAGRVGTAREASR